ncbi:MAG: M28 family peptidase [Selenomonadaceae bacterium]|nr:M28 family peptidase [Selenomonadaceae bacterium]
MNVLEDFLRPTQKQLFKRLCKKFKGKTLISKGNFILVQGQASVMLVAHLDTVHEQPVRDICLSADKNILMSPQGIGGDDRCGVFALCNIFQSAQVKPWLLFTCDEEVGGIGAKAFCLAHQQLQLPKELDNLNFLIELDRKGKNDAVFYRCANPDFEAYITSKGFKTAQGSFSDISVIAPELEVAAVNLSCGYYHAHTLHEYINRAELDDTICKVVDIISDVSHLPRFEYVEYIQSVEQTKLVSRDESVSLPRSVSASLRDIYKILLDFYSVNELESFRAEYGDQILWQIYNDEIDYFYRC